MIRHLLTMLITSLALAVPYNQTSAQSRIGTGDVNKNYQRYCAACHGDKMQGAASVSLIDDQWIHGASDAELQKVIAKGVKGTEMAGWEKQLNQEEIRSIVVLIREQRAIADADSGKKKLPEKNKDVFSTRHHSFALEEVAKIGGILWGLDFLPDGAMLVTEKSGSLWYIKGNNKMEVQGIPDVWHFRQGGLMDVKIHPNYSENRWVYLAYSENIGAKEEGDKAGMTAIVRGAIENGRWVKSKKVFSASKNSHTSSGAHFGSRIVFNDGYLFFSIGDRGRMYMAQDLSRPNGKVHRIKDNGDVPKDNPFAYQPGAVKSIWSYGNRNPQGMAVHPETGDLWAAEHGPRGGDELNLIKPGNNYGWPKVTYGINYNGKAISDKTEMPGMTPPASYWTPSIAIAGIDFYSGNKFSKWKNDLFVGGMRSEELYRVRTSGKKVVEREIVLKDEGRIRDVNNGPDGYLYLLLNKRFPESGRVVRMVPKG